jgi:hypothetical protein
MRRPTHLQERDQVLPMWGRSRVFGWHLRVTGGGSGSGYLITLHLMELGDCLLSVENVTEKAQSRLDQILTEAAQIQIEDFGGTP